MQADTSNRTTEVAATRVGREIRLDATHPAREWQSAEAVYFDTDWQGKNADPDFATEVRLLWSADRLYLQFVCHYREMFVFDNSDPSGRRDYLWERDVAEVFLQPPESIAASGCAKSTGERARASKIAYVNVEDDFDAPYASYKEFEIAPNGMWIDLDIVASGRGDLRSGLTRSVHVDEKQKVWTAEIAIAIKALTAEFDPKEPWRANFYRIEGKTEPRKYMAWQPTMAPQPNFHVPERFGIMRFR